MESRPEFAGRRVVLITSGYAGYYEHLERSMAGALERLQCAVAVLPPDAGLPAALEALQPFPPQLVLVVHGVHLPVETVRHLRERGWNTALWSIEDPYDIDGFQQIATAYDRVFTVEKACVEVYRQAGCASVHYLPLGAAADVHRPLPVGPEYQSDVCFVGAGLPNRYRVIDAAADYLASVNCKIIGPGWEGLRSADRLQAALIPRVVAPAEAARYFNGAKVNLNIFRPPDHCAAFSNRRKIPALSPNPRVFEVAASGGFLLTDRREDLASFYQIGEELDVFDTAKELVEKIRYYLQHEDRRQEMAQRALRRTREEHTYRHRLERMLQLVSGG